MAEHHASKILSVWRKDITTTNALSTISLDLIDQIASLFAIGPYYYYVLNLQETAISFVHKSIAHVLGISPDTFTIDTLFNIMHPDDLLVMKAMETRASNFFLNTIPVDQIPDYKVMYLMRLKHKDGYYRTILTQTKALHTTECGNIQTTINVHTDVTYLKMPVNHKMSFISHKHPSYYAQSLAKELQEVDNTLKTLLSNREKEIIKHISTGETAFEIADAMHISVHTVNTHKKNILKKTNCTNTTELIAKCIMEGVI